MSRAGFVSALHFENALDVLTFKLIEGESLCHGAGQAILALALLHGARQVLGTDEVTFG